MYNQSLENPHHPVSIQFHVLIEMCPLLRSKTQKFIYILLFIHTLTALAHFFFLLSLWIFNMRFCFLTPAATVILILLRKKEQSKENFHVFLPSHLPVSLFQVHQFFSSWGPDKLPSLLDKAYPSIYAGDSMPVQLFMMITTLAVLPCPSHQLPHSNVSFPSNISNLKTYIACIYKCVSIQLALEKYRD